MDFDTTMYYQDYVIDTEDEKKKEEERKNKIPVKKIKIYSNEDSDNSSDISY